MCEANAYLIKDGREEILLEDVDEIEISNEHIRLVNIFGDQKIIKGRFVSYDNSERKIIFKEE